MSGTDGQAVIIGRPNGKHGHNLSRRTLSVSEVRFPDLLAYRDDNPLPADHGAKTESDRHGYLYPRWDELGGKIELLFVVRHHRGFLRGEGRLLGLGEKTESLTRYIHVVADVRLLIGRHGLERFVLGHFMFDLEDHLAFRQNRGRCLFLGLEVFGQISPRIIHDSVRVNVGAHYLGGLFGYGSEILYLTVANRVIKGIRGGHRADQDQHDESHALLAVVRAVEEAHAGAG